MCLCRRRCFDDSEAVDDKLDEESLLDALEGRNRRDFVDGAVGNLAKGDAAGGRVMEVMGTTGTADDAEGYIDGPGVLRCMR